jgi:hypothetical protein
MFFNPLACVDAILDGIVLVKMLLLFGHTAETFKRRTTRGTAVMNTINT